MRTYADTKQFFWWLADTHVHVTDAEFWLMAQLTDQCKLWRQMSVAAFAPLFWNMPCWTLGMLTYVVKSWHTNGEVVPTEAVACGYRQSMPLMSSKACYRAIAFSIRTSVVGLSCASVWTFPSLLMTPMPEETRPKMVCFPSSHGVGANVMKNCSDTRQQVICLPWWTAMQSASAVMCKVPMQSQEPSTTLWTAACIHKLRLYLAAICVGTSIGHAENASSCMM